MRSRAESHVDEKQGAEREQSAGKTSQKVAERLVMPFEWESQHMAKFLEAYQRNELLWNVRSKDYHNKIRRQAAVSTMVKELNLPNLTDSDVVAKIKTVRSSYGAELKKIRASERSGAGTDDIYKPRLKWYQAADAFLRDVCFPNKSSSNLKVSQGESGVLKKQVFITYRIKPVGSSEGMTKGSVSRVQGVSMRSSDV